MFSVTAQHEESRLAAEVDYLFRVAFRLTGDSHDAEDLVQDVCERAVSRAPEFGSSGDCRRWLLRVLYNLYADGWRRRKRSPIVAVMDSAEKEAAANESSSGPEGMAVQADSEMALLRAWERLEPAQQALLMLRAEGHSLGELSGITELEKPVLSSRLYRARSALAKFIKEEQSAQHVRVISENHR